MNKFKIYGLENVADGAKRGGFSIQIQPNGHWVHDAIRIDVSRDIMSGDWSVSVKYSGAPDGGKSGVNEDDALDNFVEALQFARTLSKTFNPEVLEAYWQIGIKQFRERQEKAA